MNISTLCSDQAVSNIFYLIGVVVAAIRIVVPILLIVLGMVDLVKALTSQDDKQIKAATNLLIKRVVIGIVVFLVPTIIGLVMRIISQNEYTACTECVTNVWAAGCEWQQ